MKNTKINQSNEKKNLNVKTPSIQKSKHSGNIAKLKEPMRRFQTC